jgi:pimeloyl-ACP methyl ester carboxylesterase
MIMGLAGQMVAWHDEFCTRLANRGFRVIRFDNRDIGRSTWLDDQPVPNLLRLRRAVRAGRPVKVPYLLTDMAADTLGLMDALQLERAHLIGASMGGMIAQTVAGQAPDRVATLTSVMSHTGEPGLPNPHWRTMGALLVPAPRNEEIYLRRALGVWRILNGPCIAIDRSRTLEQSERAFHRGVHPAGVVRQLAAIIASPSRAGLLRSLSTPTLVIHGAEDRLIHPEGGRRTAALVPGARLEIIAEMGHALPPPLWDRLIDRFAAHAAAAGDRIAR